MKTKRIIIAAIIVAIISAALIASGIWHNSIERRIIAPIDAQLPGAGECDIDLTAIFTDLDWDTVSIFEAGENRKTNEALKLNTDIESGIVFSLNGEPVKVETADYQFDPDLIAKLDYIVYGDRPYATSPRENATAHARKFEYNGGYCYYLIYK